MLPGCLFGTAWERSAPSITLPFFPVRPEGTFRSLSFVLSARRQLCPGLALGTCRAWGQTGRGGWGWTAAFLCPGSAAIGPLFLLEASGLGELEGSTELIASASSLIASRIPSVAVQSASHQCLHILSDRELTVSLRGLISHGTASVLGKSMS